MRLNIKQLDENLIKPLLKSFSNDSISGSENYYKRCVAENREGKRVTFVALVNNIPIGVVHLINQSKYLDFADNNIPEINDLNVISIYQKKGIGTKLIEACEQYAFKNGHTRIGIGVGLYKDYGRAHRLYFNLGYKPDGKGLMYAYKEVKPGKNVFVDDDLNLYMIKYLVAETCSD